MLARESALDRIQAARIPAGRLAAAAHPSTRGLRGSAFFSKGDGFVKSPKTIFGIHHDVVDHLISSIYCSIVFHFGLFTKPSRV